jgi:ATP-binding cassette, subfamily G (WHITE), member 2, SNQ2
MAAKPGRKRMILVKLIIVLVFCDEPTSGLDSQAAWGVVQFLRKLSDAGQSILCTIHQPSAVLFEQFDRLLLLQKGGKTVYFGDTGEGSRILIDYFEKNGGAHCDPDANPAEYILEQIGAGATGNANQDWHDVWPFDKVWLMTGLAF